MLPLTNSAIPPPTEDNKPATIKAPLEFLSSLELLFELIFGGTEATVVKDDKPENTTATFITPPTTNNPVPISTFSLPFL
ncbi:MAG: hypothetical protein EAZ80_07150 [Runella slithyformis]|nr:MAG: hypothetical protein EAZ80_07150 [Runella slithyformis]